MARRQHARMTFGLLTRSRPALLVLLALCSYSCLRASQAAHDPSEVPLTFTDENNRLYVQTITGRRWHVLQSEEHDNRVFFADLETNEAMWEDPRTLPLTDEERASLTPEMLARWENDTTLSSLSNEVLAAAGLHRQAAAGGVTVALVAMVPLVLLTGAMVGRIWYLHAYYPELLFPSKERKSRQRGNHKFKPQKARGKLNQDNKGGRSNNT